MGVDNIYAQRPRASEAEPENEENEYYEDDEDYEDDGDYEDYFYFSPDDYAMAFKGKTFHANLKKGDRIGVSSSEGIWKAELLKYLKLNCVK